MNFNPLIMISTQKSVLFAITYFVCSMNLLAQTSEHPFIEIKANSKQYQEKASKINSRVMLTETNSAKIDSTTSKEPIPTNKTVIRTVYEGSKNLNETRTQKFAGKEEVVIIGKGNFKNILYVDKLTNQIIKVKHINTMEYMYGINEDEKSNTERIEVNIYYENENPFYAIFKEDHYKNKEKLFFSNKYALQITPYHQDMYFSNDFQKTIYKYIQDLSTSILKQK